MAKVRVAKKKATTIRPTKDGTVVRLYETDIVTIHKNGDIELYTGGHNTPTTRRRMNEVADEFELYYKVYTKGGTTYVDTVGRRGNDETFVFSNDRVRFPGPGHLIANPRLRRKRKTMARKKRRTAKQIAATKKLVAFNKKRRGKKKTSRKTTRRKVVRKKATRRRARRNPVTNPRKKRARRSPALRSSAYVIFKCTGSSVMYLGLDRRKNTKWTGDKQIAIHFPKKFVALRLAKTTRGATGVAGNAKTKSQIVAACKAPGKV